MSVSRFAELIGVPRRTYQYRLAKHRAGDPPKGPWPAPVVDRIEPVVAKYAQDWPAWGHRKIAAIARIDGHDIGSMSSVKRAMARRGLLQPVRYQAERRQLAAARRAVFVEPVERKLPGLADGASPSSRPPQGAPGASAASWTTSPSSPWRARSPPPAPPRTSPQPSTPQPHERRPCSGTSSATTASTNTPASRRPSWWSPTTDRR